VPKLHDSANSCPKTLPEEDTWNPTPRASTLHTAKPRKQANSCSLFPVPPRCNSYLPITTLESAKSLLFSEERSHTPLPERWLSGILSALSSIPAVSGLFLSTNYSAKVYKFFKLHLLLNTDKVVTLRSKTIFLMKPTISQAPTQRPPNFR